ncbi:hypothetical protein, partial [Promicromonospora kroppenstedtii]|uniref:hypothetical protein n=1 Tax=Promicromonospora kroppenstedtii TaxID=440482 RepID=UPI001B7FC35D
MLDPSPERQKAPSSRRSSWASVLGAFPDAKLLVHSAHEFKTAKNGFDRILSPVPVSPGAPEGRADRRLVVKTANAQESLSFDGRTIKFFARSKNSGRGFSADLLILDEAQELSEDHLRRDPAD